MKEKISTQVVRLLLAGSVAAAMTLGLAGVASAASDSPISQRVRTDTKESGKATVRSAVDAALKKRPELVPADAAASDTSIAAACLGEANGLDALVTVSANHGEKSIIKSSGSSTSLITVLDSGSSASFDVNLPQGYKAKVEKDGSVSLLSSGNDHSIRFIEAPWAVDATGKALKTEYQVKGSTLVQSVATDGATYPIVADPQFGWMGIFPVVQFNKSETALSRTASGVLIACSRLSGGLPAPAPIGAMAFRYTGGYCR